MAEFGCTCIKEFQPESKSIAACFEQLKMFFAASNVAEDKIVLILLSVSGMKTYSLLFSLLALKAMKDEASANLEKGMEVTFRTSAV